MLQPKHIQDLGSDSLRAKKSCAALRSTSGTSLSTWRVLAELACQVWLPVGILELHGPVLHSVGLDVVPASTSVLG